MHDLHKYLISLSPTFGSPEEIAEKFQRINYKSFEKEVLSHVLEQTDIYTDLFDANQVYDYREEGPGSWDYQYPPVLFGRRSKKQFLKEFNDAVNTPYERLMSYFEVLSDYLQKNKFPYIHLANKSTVSIKFSKTLIETLKTDYIPGGILYNLESIVSILSKEYTYRVPYYDLINKSIITPPETIQDVKEHPENYALVFINCHY